MTEFWKNSFLSYEIIMYYATEENKWEILEYYAKENPEIFKSIIKYYVFSHHKECVGFKKQEIISRYQNADWSKLPTCLKDLFQKTKQELENLKTSTEKRNSTREENQVEELKTWTNETIFSIEFFDKKSKKFYQFNITTRDDGLLILQKYLNNSFSKSSFCAFYGITDPKGFELLLKKFSAESEELKNIIKERSSINQRSYKNKLINLIKSSINGEISLDVIINNHQSLTLDDFIKFCESLDKGQGNHKIAFLKKVLEYFNERISSFDISQNSKNPQNFITNSELRFLIGWKNFKSLEQGKWFIIDKLVARKFSHLKENDYKFYKEKFFLVTSILTTCHKRFNKKQYLSGTHKLLLPNNEIIEITPTMVESAVKFVKKLNLYPCPSIFRAIFRAIAKQELIEPQISFSPKYAERPDLSNQQIYDLASFLDAFTLQEDETEIAD